MSEEEFQTVAQQEAPPPDEDKEEEINFIQELNDEFFLMANKTIQSLVEENRIGIASDVKKYVKVLYGLSQEYAKELTEKSIMKPRLLEADQKLRFALSLTNDSQQAMSSLREALENAWRDADASKAREQDFQDQLREMIIKCEKLTKKSDDAGDEDDAAQFGSLSKFKPIILRERDRLNGEVNELSRRVQMQRLYIESLEKVWQNAEEVVEKTTRRVENLESLKVNLEKRIKHLKDEYDELKEVNTFMIRKGEFQTKQINDQTTLLLDKNREIERMKSTLDRNKTEMLMNNKLMQKQKGEMQNLNDEKRTLQNKYQEMRNQFKEKSEAFSNLNKGYKKLKMEFDNEASKTYKLTKQNGMIKSEMNRLKGVINTMDKKLNEAATKFANLKRLRDIILHERDGLRSDVTKLNNLVADLKNTVMTKTNNIDNLNLEIKRYQHRMDDAKKEMARIEKERDEQIEEVHSLNDKIDNMTEQLEHKTEQVNNLNTTLEQKNIAFLKLQKTLEATNSERLVLQRTLQSCCEERTNLKNLLSKQNLQLSQLTEEITASQNKINSLHLAIERIRGEKQEVETELRNTRNTLKDTRDELKEMKNKNENLLRTIADDEQRFLKLSIQIDDLRKEKNLVGLQMVRRNDEIIVLKERLNILQISLDRGELQYTQRLEDIRLLKIEVSSLQTQRDVLKRGIESTADMRQEVIRLQRVANQEKVKCRALTEDLKTPANIHRWRILNGTDPERFALIKKAQVLQKRILLQNNEIIKHEKMLQDSHKLFLSLKTYVEKLPSLKIKENLVKTQRMCRSKDKKLKVLAAELNAITLEAKAKDCEIKDLKVSMTNLQKEFYADKKMIYELKMTCQQKKPTVDANTSAIAQHVSTHGFSRTTSTHGLSRTF